MHILTVNTIAHLPRLLFVGNDGMEPRVEIAVNQQPHMRKVGEFFGVPIIRTIVL